jgi:murein DD-endopeptidase MepM/ murein hydrolase activator NlpD
VDAAAKTCLLLPGQDLTAIAPLQNAGYLEVMQKMLNVPVVNCCRPSRTCAGASRFRLALCLTAALLAGWTDSAACAAPRFEQPISCVVGRDCFIQNYFDRDAGPGHADYHCGFLTYNGHTGTDFRVRDLVAMNRKVAVVAAAAGTILNTRDTEADINIRVRGKADLKGKDAGNGVVISHGDGWETQYSHLLRGSIRVHAGQQVEAGEVLGYVGLSGNTEFPHVDFTVRKDGKRLDPFAPGETACGSAVNPLWSDKALTALQYVPTGVLIAGFAERLLSRDEAEAGLDVAGSLPVTADRIAFWIELFGVQKDDRLSIELSGPDKQKFPLYRKDNPVNKAVLYIAAGKQRGERPWKPGRYRASFRLQRGGKLLLEEQREIEVH